MGFTTIFFPAHSQNNVYGRFTGLLELSGNAFFCFHFFRFIQLPAVSVVVKGGDEKIEGVM